MLQSNQLLVDSVKRCKLTHTYFKTFDKWLLLLTAPITSIFFRKEQLSFKCPQKSRMFRQLRPKFYQSECRLPSTSRTSMTVVLSITALNSE